MGVTKVIPPHILLSKHMIKTIGHSVRSVYNSGVAKIIDVRKWLPSMRKGSTRYVIEKELEAIALEEAALKPRVDAILYLLKKL
ncbi:MAG: hypothetical protein CME21_21640 [Gemmatimonadetes bacterium]|nr:hypothetical protein [Gemmatimonadota bacterium]